MRFDLRRPCPNCPFRPDCLRGWLGRTRAEEIADAILGERPGTTFACHQTTENGGAPPESEQHCVGAILLVESEGAANQMLQIAERLGLLDPATISPDARALVFPTGAAFVEHHAAFERGPRDVTRDSERDGRVKPPANAAAISRGTR